MTSRQHQDWLNRGKPDSGLALPLQLLANLLAAAGYTVYVYPNDAHLDAEPPEDHTYYSETGWPGTSPKWWRHAIDIMPPPSGRGLPSLTELGQTIFNARQAGLIIWLKYMNWPSDGNLSRAVQDRWEPGHSRGPSGDAGHIHLSSITGCEVLDDSFNPLTSVIVAGTTTPGEDVTPEEHIKLDAAFNLYDTVQLPGGGETNFPVPLTKHIKAIEAQGVANAAALAALRTDMAALKAPGALDPAVFQQAVTAAVMAALKDPAVTAVLVSAAEAGANKAEDE